MDFHQLLPELLGPVSLAVVGYLLSRSIREIDVKLDRNCLATEQLKIQVHGYDLALRIQSERLEKVEHENNVLRNSLALVDRQMAVMVAQKRPSRSNSGN